MWIYPHCLMPRTPYLDVFNVQGPAVPMCRLGAGKQCVERCESQAEGGTTGPALDARFKEKNSLDVHTSAGE